MMVFLSMLSRAFVWAAVTTCVLKPDAADALMIPGPRLLRTTPRSAGVERNAAPQGSEFDSGDISGDRGDGSSRSNKDGHGRTKKKSKQSSTASKPGPVYTGPGFRVVRCFPQLPRRSADAAVAAGRVRVNGVVVQPSKRLIHGDTLTLDGKQVAWEARAAAEKGAHSAQTTSSINEPKSSSPKGSSAGFFSYFKYHKPVGVTSTTDPNDVRGLHHALSKSQRRVLQGSGGSKGSGSSSSSSSASRLFPVGRLDMDSRGLVLLTNDGRLADVLQQPGHAHEKEYLVRVEPPLQPEQVAALAAGVVIETKQQRTGAVTTAATLPCTVELLPANTLNTPYPTPHGLASSSPSSSLVRFVLEEGRHRQIRKMVETLRGHRVVDLLRVQHGTLKLGSLAEGDLTPVNGNELTLLLATATPATIKSPRPSAGSRQLPRASIRRYGNGRDSRDTGTRSTGSRDERE